MTTPAKKAKRRGVSSPGGPDRLDDADQKKATNPDGATPAELPTVKPSRPPAPRSK